MSASSTITSAPVSPTSRSTASSAGRFPWMSASTATRMLARVEEGHQAGGSHRPVRVLAELRDLGPVQCSVETHADPAAAADVGRAEEPAGRRRDELGLRAWQPGAPQVRKIVIVMPGG